MYNALYYLGAIAAAWITYGTFPITNDWGWRIPSFMQMLSSVIQLLSCFFIVESPRVSSFLSPHSLVQTNTRGHLRRESALD